MAELPANFENAKAASNDLVDIIKQETENYGKYGMMGPDMFATIAGICEHLNPEVLAMVGEMMTDNGVPPEAAKEALNRLPHVATGLLVALIQGQEP